VSDEPGRGDDGADDRDDIDDERAQDQAKTRFRISALIASSFASRRNIDCCISLRRPAISAFSSPAARRSGPAARP
jgi:hypothetical protein